MGKGVRGMDQLTCFKHDLEYERALKINSMNSAYNPVEREFLERELVLIDAQISWIEDAIAAKTAA